MPDVVAVGSALLDRHYLLSNLPDPDGGAFVHDERTAVGGVAANVASGLAELGRSVGVVSRLGDDEAGARVVADLRERGIDADHVRRMAGERSSYSMVLRDDDGRRMIVAGGESVPNLRLTDADEAYLRSADAVFTSAYAPDRVSARLAELASDGPSLAFDLAGPLSELDGRGTTRETLDALLPVADLFVVNEVAARSYLECDPRATAEELHARGVRRAAVTRGEDGALLVDQGDVVSIPAFDVDVVDTTGAGDAFSAGLLHAWVLEGRDPLDAGRFAAAAAALNCTADGARGGLPDEAAVDALLS